MKTLPLLALAALLSACATPPVTDDPYVEGFIAAEDAARPFAPITDSRPAATLAEAYQAQAQIIAAHRAKGDRVVGYRGGLMSQASMAGRGVTAPLVGVMFASGRVRTGGRIPLCGYRKATLELKLGFVFRDAVRSPPADAAQVAKAVAAVTPVVDLPDIGYRNPDKYGAADMVAANITAARYVTGGAHAPTGFDLNGLKVSLTRDGEPVTSGFGRQSLDDQWQSLLAVTRQVLATGRTIRPGDMVMTGRMGERPWLTPGDYRADYGPLGVVAFRVEGCSAR
jgi:2-keto-4-pentenoate hydratase